jgi:hypothetical protein
MKATTPNPPIKCVALLQNNNPLGKASTFTRIEEPVVVYPLTLSNQAFIRENSPPQRTYGNIPNKQERIQAKTTTTNPSFKFGVPLFLTKISGNVPAASVIIALKNKGENEASNP